MGRLNTWPFLSSFFSIISLQNLFCSADNTTDANSTPSVARVSDIFVIFVLAWLDWITTSCVAIFIGDGYTSFNERWP